MTQEEKQLLLKDLCARLPYGVTVRVEGASNFDGEIEPYDTPLSLGLLHNFRGHSFTLKPYLRPLSGMTEEERKELKSILREKSFAVDCHNELIIYTNSEYDCDHYFSVFYDVQDWCNKHYFDYRGLIEKGLALEAPEDMYKIE